MSHNIVTITVTFTWMFAGLGHTSHRVEGTSVPSGCRAAAARHQTTRLSMSCQLCGEAKGPATFASSSRSSIAFASLHVTTWHGRREVFYILWPASSLMNVPRYVNPDKLMNVPVGHICLQVTVLNCPEQFRPSRHSRAAIHGLHANRKRRATNKQHTKCC